MQDKNDLWLHEDHLTTYVIQTILGIVCLQNVEVAEAKKMTLKQNFEVFLKFHSRVQKLHYLPSVDTCRKFGCNMR